MRFVKNLSRREIKQQNGSKYVTLRQLVKKFYVSRFNRDNMHDPAEGEDINNSRKYRIYNMCDVQELLETFISYCEWAVNEENISRINLSTNLILIRESVDPKLKYVTALDSMYTRKDCEKGQYYITDGRYDWTLCVKGEPLTKMKELWMKDPTFIKKKEELKPIMEERNKNAKSKHTD